MIYQDLPVDKDEAAAIEAMRFIGCDKMYILNDKKEDITKRQIMKTNNDLINQFNKNPTRKYVEFCFVAGHGILKEGQQHLMLNETSPSEPKFVLYNIENIIRYMAFRFSNSYIVGAFACCRERFDPEQI